MKRLKKIVNYLRQKTVETNGESHALAILGWSFVAIAIVLAVYAMLPNLVTNFITNIFSRMTNGLGL